MAKGKLYDNVVVIQARIKCPSQSKKDVGLSEQLCQQTGADTQSLRVRKDLLRLRAATKFRDKCRKILREECVPWSTSSISEEGVKKEDPLWACSGRKIASVADQLQECREDFFDAVRLMCDNYDGLIEDAKGRLGTAFNPDEFPSVEEFESRFTWEVEITPLLDLENLEHDFRVKLPEKLAEDQIQLHQKNMAKRVSNSVDTARKRVADLIIGDNKNPGIVTKLRKYNPDEDDKRKGNSFRDKIIYEKFDEVREWVDGVNDFADDDDLTELLARMDEFTAKVRPIDPAKIRTNKQTREAVIKGLVRVMDATGESDHSTVPASTKGRTGAAQFL